jgi:hypothetical protein
MPMRARLPLATCLVLLLALVAAASPKPTVHPCPGGRFVMKGRGLMPSAQPEAVMVFGSYVSIEGFCPQVAGRVKNTKHGTVLTASWTSCAVRGPVRLRATIGAPTCERMAGTVSARRLKRTFRAKRAALGGGGGGDPGGNQPAGGGVDCSVPPANTGRLCPGDDTYQQIERRIFAQRGCNLSGCHGSALAGGLDLRPGLSYANLVGVPATNAVALAAGKLRVVPGNPAASFLAQKVRDILAPGEGMRMPTIGPSLPKVDLDLLDAWINACAPKDGKVADAPCLPPEQYEETPPLDPPPGGYQMVLLGPVLQPGQEQEGCLWIPAPNATDVPIKKVELALNPGTHHFSIWRHNGTGTPPLNQWLAGDVACLNSGASFGQSVAGSPQWPYFVSENQPGIASVLPGGGYYGLNAHYYNEFSVPIQIKVWTNFYPYQPGEPPPAHYSQTIIALDTTFNINVPPYTQKTQHGRYLNTSAKTRYVLGVGGHMHKRGIKFTIWQSDGTKVLEDHDWAHPSFKGYWPPYAMKPGDFFDYECWHDNGVTRPLRTDAYGHPKTITFGVSAEDEMCILTGSYYDD